MLIITCPTLIILFNMIGIIGQTTIQLLMTNFIIYLLPE